MRNRGSILSISLLVWAGFFTYLWLTGEVARYLGPRTYWVVWFGAVALVLAALGHLVWAPRPRDGRRPTGGEVAGAVLFLLPVLAVAAVPRAELGALAASRKSLSSGVGAGSAFAPVPELDGDIGFVDIHFAGRSGEYAAALGIAEGAEIELLGFVAHPGGVGPPRLALTRFYVSCCAADAIPYSVIVDLSDTSVHAYREDRWLEVSGQLIKEGERFVLQAQEVRPRPEPDDPYLY